MEKYYSIFKKFKQSLCEFITSNINTCDEPIVTACLYITQTDFSDLQKYIIGKELFENFKDDLLKILNKDFSNIASVLILSDYIKYEVIEEG